MLFLKKKLFVNYIKKHTKKRTITIPRPYSKKYFLKNLKIKWLDKLKNNVFFKGSQICSFEHQLVKLYLVNYPLDFALRFTSRTKNNWSRYNNNSEVRNLRKLFYKRKTNIKQVENMSNNNVKEENEQKLQHLLNDKRN